MRKLQVDRRGRLGGNGTGTKDTSGALCGCALQASAQIVEGARYIGKSAPL